MKVSYQWLCELSGVDWPVSEVAERLTLCGTACEDVIPTHRHLENVTVGEVTALGPIKGADKIQLATVNLGSETLDLVCGAPNVAVGQKVPVALVGAKLAGGMEIKKVKIRGVESTGMICSERELGFSEDHSGIMVLDESAPVGTPLVEYLDYEDYILDFELTPNRADSMSAVGIARDLAALAGKRLNYPEVELKTIDEKVSDVFDASSEDTIACPRFTARIIRNVKPGPSPWWMQKRLLSAGMRPISNIVDITNYVMLETGNPIHAFDYDRFDSDRIVVRKARDGEMLKTLDGKEHRLTDDVLLITDGTRARAAAGVMGGFDSEVTDDTKNVLLEVAYFDPTVIRKSRKALGMMSEASNRFEKGVDPNNLPHASGRVAQLLQELCGGEVLDGMVDFYPDKIEPARVFLRPQRCNEILGTELTEDRMVEWLGNLELEVERGEKLTVTVPTFRPDLTREIDLVEEVARMEGYHQIPDATGNKGPLFAPENKTDRFEWELRSVLTGAGFDEILGHGLADSKQAALLKIDRPLLKIINPVSEDLDTMRIDLAQTALNIIAHNLAHRNISLRLFEIGKVYYPPDKNDNWVEEDRLMLAVTGRVEGNWRDRERPADFYDLKGGLETLTRHFHWPEIEYRAAESSYFEPGRSFALTLNGDEIGSAGQLESKIARRFEIKQDVFLMQIRLQPLFELSHDLVAFEPLPTFPAATRDLAIVISEATPVGDVIRSIQASAGELAEAVELFDLYTGEQIGKGRKSVAVAIRFRSPERSLSSEEVDKLQENIVSRLRKDFKAEIRDR